MKKKLLILMSTGILLTGCTSATVTNIETITKEVISSSVVETAKETEEKEIDIEYSTEDIIPMTPIETKENEINDNKENIHNEEQENIKDEVLDDETKIIDIGIIKSFEENGILIELDNEVEMIANISEDTIMDSNLTKGDKVSISHSDIMTMSLPGIWPQVYEISRVADLM